MNNYFRCWIANQTGYFTQKIIVFSSLVSVPFRFSFAACATKSLDHAVRSGENMVYCRTRRSVLHREKVPGATIVDMGWTSVPCSNGPHKYLAVLLATGEVAIAHYLNNQIVFSPVKEPGHSHQHCGVGPKNLARGRLTTHQSHRIATAVGQHVIIWEVTDEGTDGHSDMLSVE